MEKALARLPMPSTTSSLEQRVESAKLAIVQETSPSFALRAAKQLVGSFPHARPPEPEIYAGALGATLAQYPLAVVQECVDPRGGLARKLRFPPTVADVVEWCDSRLAYYRAMATYQPREQKPDREFTDEERRLAREFLANLAAELKSRHLRAALTSRAAEHPQEHP